MNEPRSIPVEKEQPNQGETSPFTVIAAALILSLVLGLCCYFLLK